MYNEIGLYESNEIEEIAEVLGAAVGGGMLMFIVVMYAIAFTFILAQYIINAIALMRMAKKLDIPYAWLGFVPVADMYLLGKIADAGAEKKHNAKRLLIGYIVFAVLFVVYLVAAFVMGAMSAITESVAPMVAFLFVAFLFIACAVCVSVFAYIAYYRVCENFGGKHSIWWFLGILLGGMLVSTLIPAILMLILSGKAPESQNKVGTPEEPIVVDAPHDSVF